MHHKLVMNVYEDCIDILNIKRVIDINKDFVSVQYKDYYIDIKGNDLKVKKMLDNELLILGEIKKIEYR